MFFFVLTLLFQLAVRSPFPCQKHPPVSTMGDPNWEEKNHCRKSNGRERRANRKARVKQ